MTEHTPGEVIAIIRATEPHRHASDDYGIRWVTLPVRSVDDLLAENARLREELGRYKELREGDPWSQEVRDALAALEEKHDIELVSIGHHAKWVRVVETAEKELARLREVNAGLVGALKNAVKVAEMLAEAHTSAGALEAWKFELHPSYAALRAAEEGA